MTAATPAAVAVTAGQAATLPLLHTRILPIGSGTLPARLYALGMQLSPSEPQMAETTALIGVAFDTLFPQALQPTDFMVTLGDGRKRVEINESNILQLSSDARGYVLSLELPQSFRGSVCSCSNAAAQLRLVQ
jgi:hypothetical protein